MKNSFNDAYRLFHKGILVFSRMERQGLRINLETCNKEKEKITNEINRLEEEFKSNSFFEKWKDFLKKEPNIYSNPQLSSFLSTQKTEKTRKLTPSGKICTDIDSLESLNFPELTPLLKIRKLKKIRDTYLEGYLKEQVCGIIRPSFNLHTVSTFRSSSNNPNLQNIPVRDLETMKICRKIIEPRPGNHLLEIDFSAMEVRIAACYHQDPTMLSYIKENKDMHGDMAEQIFKIRKLNKAIPGHKLLRSAAKNAFVFAQFYGDYYKNCASNLLKWVQLPTSKKWSSSQGVELETNLLIGEHFIMQGWKRSEDFTAHVQEVENHFWNKKFFVYKEWKEKWWKEYKKKGYIDMLTGFRCSGEMSFNDCINYPIQGTAFHCLLWCLIEIDEFIKNRKLESRIINQIHDSMLLDVPPSELSDIAERIKVIASKELQETWKWIIVPMQIEIQVSSVNGNWAEMKDFSK